MVCQRTRNSLSYHVSAPCLLCRSCSRSSVIFASAVCKTGRRGTPSPSSKARRSPSANSTLLCPKMLQGELNAPVPDDVGRKPIEGGHTHLASCLPRLSSLCSDSVALMALIESTPPIFMLWRLFFWDWPFSADIKSVPLTLPQTFEHLPKEIGLLCRIKSIRTSHRHTQTASASHLMLLELLPPCY